MQLSSIGRSFNDQHWRPNTLRRTELIPFLKTKNPPCGRVSKFSNYYLPKISITSLLSGLLFVGHQLTRCSPKSRPGILVLLRCLFQSIAEYIAETGLRVGRGLLRVISHIGFLLTKFHK